MARKSKSKVEEFIESITVMDLIVYMIGLLMLIVGSLAVKIVGIILMGGYYYIFKK